MAGGFEGPAGRVVSTMVVVGEGAVVVASLVVGSVDVSAVGVVPSVDEPRLLASTGVPSSADAPNAPPSAAPAANRRVATKTMTTDRARIDPRSSSRGRGIGV